MACMKQASCILPSLDLCAGEGHAEQDQVVLGKTPEDHSMHGSGSGMSWDALTCYAHAMRACFPCIDSRGVLSFDFLRNRMAAFLPAALPRLPELQHLHVRLPQCDNGRAGIADGAFDALMHGWGLGIPGSQGCAWHA